MLLLAWFEKVSGKVADVVIVFGKVPFFYYIFHFFLAHIAAIVVGVFQGFAFSDFLVGPWQFPEGFGLGLPGVYLITIMIVSALYPVCNWYANLKKRTKNPLLTYL